MAAHWRQSYQGIRSKVSMMAYVRKRSKKQSPGSPTEIVVSHLESMSGILVTTERGDSSPLKHAEHDLEEMNARYHGLLEATADPMVVVDEAGMIVVLNAKAEKQFGYGPDELVGRRVNKLIPTGFAERLIADGTRTMAEALDQQIDTGIELTGLRKDGSEFPIEIMLSPLEGPEGTLVTTAIRDITARKVSESNLAHSDAKYRGLLEAAPDAMVVVNQDGEIVLLNAQAEMQFGYRRDELVGQKVISIIPDGFAERLITDGIRTAAEALAQHIGTGIELWGKRKDGSSFPIEIMLSPLDDGGEVLVTAAIRNITTRKDAEKHLAHIEAEQRLERECARVAREEQVRLQLIAMEKSRDEKVRLQDKFLSHVSHELRTPLTATYFFTTNLLDGLLGDLSAEQHEHLTHAVDNISQLKDMVSDLLEITRLDAHKITLDLQCINLSQLITDVISTCQLNAAENDVLLQSLASSEFSLIWADATRVRQILTNLIDNGIKFSLKSGTVTVEIRPSAKDDSFVCLSVSDTGCGISSENLAIVFDRLAQIPCSEDKSPNWPGVRAIHCERAG
jgi:PAS domain S-box-containing protein